MLKFNTLKELLCNWIGFDCDNTLSDIQSDRLFGAYLLEQTNAVADPVLIAVALNELIDEGRVVRLDSGVQIDEDGVLRDYSCYEIPNYHALYEARQSREDHDD